MEMCYIVATKHSGSLKVRCTSMLGCLTGLINLPVEAVLGCTQRGFFPGTLQWPLSGNTMSAGQAGHMHLAG